MLPYFPALSDVAPSTVTESNIVKPSLFGTSDISISGGSGQYALSDDGISFDAYTSVAGTITNGQYVKVKVTSSASSLGLVETTLTISKDSISDASTFSVTTEDADAPSLLWADDAEVFWADSSAVLWAS